MNCDKHYNNEFKKTEDYLAKIPPKELLDKISNFRKLKFNEITDQELSLAIINVLTYNGIFCCFKNTNVLTKNTVFYRIKKLDGSNFPNPRFSKMEDFWETDSKYVVNYGRLNKPRESLLYVSPDLDCCIDEVKLKKDDFFVIIKYIAKEDIKINQIGCDFNYDDIGVKNPKAILVHEIYNNFLREEFSRKVKKGDEYLYRISEHIAKNYFDLPPRIVQDAWAYKSIKDKNKLNICFRPAIAHQVLKLECSLICKFNDDYKFSLVAFSNGCDGQGNIKAYTINSRIIDEFMPELSKCD